MLSLRLCRRSNKVLHIRKISESVSTARSTTQEIPMTQVVDHLNHSTWECKYHVVFTPKYRKKVLFGHIRKELKDVFHRLALQKGCKIEEGHLMPDHVHRMISIPPKHAVAGII